MDWIRRNWPDLLIGVALVAVIAMIVATLLSGGSLPSLLQRNTPPELPITRTTGQTNSPANGANGNAPATANTPSTASGDTGSGDTETSTTNTQDSNLDVFVPGTSEGADTTDTGANAGTETEAAGDTEAGTVGAATDGAAPANSNAGVNTPLPQSVPNGGFRVAAGAVDSRESALTAAQTFRDADYTVTVEQQDDLYLLWIGPYASDAGAERVAARLQEDGLVPDALVYTYDPDDGAEAGAPDEAEGAAGAEAATPVPDNAATNTAQTNPNASAPANANAQAGSSGAGAAASADTGLSAPAGQRFLQVGAFRSDETAQPQLEQLESLGLTVTSDEDDEGIVRLYVGPFTGAQLAQTQTRLSNQGIDSFPVTP